MCCCVNPNIKPQNTRQLQYTSCISQLSSQPYWSITIQMVITGKYCSDGPLPLLQTTTQESYATLLEIHPKKPRKLSVVP